MDAEILKFQVMCIFDILTGPKGMKPITMVQVHANKEKDVMRAAFKARCIVQILARRLTESLIKLKF